MIISKKMLIKKLYQKIKVFMLNEVNIFMYESFYFFRLPKLFYF